MQELAIKKLNEEEKDFKGDKYGNAVYKHVANILRDFCLQDGEFAQAVYQTDRTLSDCVKEIMQGCGSAISDLEVYRKAVAFYFPGAGIQMHMTINLCESVEQQAPAKPGIVLDLLDLI